MEFLLKLFFNKYTHPIVLRVFLRQWLFILTCILILGTYIYHQIVSFKWIYTENTVGLINYTIRIYIIC